jgi:hypothetical protein
MMSDKPFFGSVLPRWSRRLFPTYYIGLLFGWSVMAFFGIFAGFAGLIVALFQGVRDAWEGTP